MVRPSWVKKSMSVEFITVAVVMVLIVLGWLAYQRNRSVKEFVLPSVPISVAYTCQNGESTLSCYALRYQKLTRDRGVAAAFAELKTAYTTDPLVRTYCHPLAHVIGRTEADRLSSVTEAFTEGDHFCMEGYYHGAMESIVYRIGMDRLPIELPNICAAAQKSQHLTCVHGLGHGVMAVSNNDVFLSLKLCDRLAGNQDQQTCSSGVFMENVLDETSPDHPSSFKVGQPMYPCTAVDPKYASSCYYSQAPHALRATNNDFPTVFRECAALELNSRVSCYQSLGREAAGHAQGTVELTKATCLLGPTEEAQANCFNGAVGIFHDYYLDKMGTNELCPALPSAFQYLCPGQATKGA